MPNPDTSRELPAGTCPGFGRPELGTGVPGTGVLIDSRRPAMDQSRVPVLEALQEFRRRGDVVYGPRVTSRVAGSILG
jgi:hypothetical protein